jgi:DNA-directed RNA polymerase specialized sigma24 family protein
MASVKERKRIIYVDMDHVEFGRQLTKLEARTREKLLTTRELDAHIFWLDIEEGLKGLTEMQRKCFIAKFIEGYTEREIAAGLHICRSVAHKHVEASREKMKIFLEQGGQKG